MLAIERARRMRGTAAVAVSGVVASLSLAVALTVMVASFRESVTHWLDVVLPADLYVRATSGGRGGNSGGTSSTDTATFPPAFVQALAQRARRGAHGHAAHAALQLDASQPAVTLIARSMEGDRVAIAAAGGIGRCPCPRARSAST
jgi:putative ABC transport system permease protein